MNSHLISSYTSRNILHINILTTNRGFRDLFKVKSTKKYFPAVSGTMLQCYNATMLEIEDSAELMLE